MIWLGKINKDKKKRRICSQLQDFETPHNLIDQTRLSILSMHSKHKNTNKA